MNPAPKAASVAAASTAEWFLVRDREAEAWFKAVHEFEKCVFSLTLVATLAITMMAVVLFINIGLPTKTSPEKSVTSSLVTIAVAAAIFGTIHTYMRFARMGIDGRNPRTYASMIKKIRIAMLVFGASSP